MDGEGVDGGCEMLGVDLCKLFSPAVIFVINIHHLVSHLPGTNSMNFKHLQKQTRGEYFINLIIKESILSLYLLCVWIICIQSSELKFGVSEEYQEVRTVALLNLLHHPPPGLFVDLVQRIVHCSLLTDLTSPGRTTYSTALSIIGLFVLLTGSLYSLAEPEVKIIEWYVNKLMVVPELIKLFSITLKLYRFKCV